MSENTYTYQRPGSFFDRLSLRKRMEMLDRFLNVFPGHETNSVLDVGVTADKSFSASNYLEKYYPVKSKITALSNQDASYLEDIYPGLTFRLGDARALPFADNSIDVVFSSAVLEHVGSFDNQKKMIAECYRVAKHGIFITTPNRWYPIEFHTLLPLLHWLPKTLHRVLLKIAGMPFYASENNLNLLGRQHLARLCRDIGIERFDIETIKTFGLPSNLILIAKK